MRHDKKKDLQCISTRVLLVTIILSQRLIAQNKRIEIIAPPHRGGKREDEKESEPLEPCLKLMWPACQ